MHKRNITFGLLAVALIAYLAVMLPVSHNYAQAQPLTAFEVNVADPQQLGFVTAADIAGQTDSLDVKYRDTTRGQVDLLSLQQKLMAMDKVEDVRVSILNDGTLYIDVHPMEPIARVFNPKGSHYINRQGKQISTSLQYRVDVPVVLGDFKGDLQPTQLIPVLEYIKKTPQLDALVSAVKLNPNGDVILIPCIEGHVVNFGDTTMLADKWQRLQAVYRKVMPAKGWLTYDTISLKWRGQAVATRHIKRAQAPTLSQMLAEDTTRVESTEVMVAEEINPGGFMLPDRGE